MSLFRIHHRPVELRILRSRTHVTSLFLENNADSLTSVYRKVIDNFNTPPSFLFLVLRPRSQPCGRTSPDFSVTWQSGLCRLRMIFTPNACFLFLAWHTLAGLPGNRPKAGGRKKIKPDELLVPLSSTHYCAYTYGRSTWWSTTTLQGKSILGKAWRLDAFSAYPVRT